MAKVKKSARGRGRPDKRRATVVNPESGEAMLLPPPRDLKHHLTIIQIKKAACDKANAELRHAFKVADESGVNGNAVRKGLALHKKDALSAKAEMLQLSLVLQELGSPVQFNVHEAKYKDAVEEAKVKGFGDGKAARAKDHPWVKASPAARQYDESYEEGQLENISMSAADKRRALKVVKGEPEQAAAQ